MVISEHLGIRDSRIPRSSSFPAVFSPAVLFSVGSPAQLPVDRGPSPNSHLSGYTTLKTLFLLVFCASNPPPFLVLSPFLPSRDPSLGCFWDWLSGDEAVCSPRRETVDSSGLLNPASAPPQPQTVPPGGLFVPVLRESPDSDSVLTNVASVYIS